MRKKRQSSQQSHLALLGPTSVKAASKTLVKLIPGVKTVSCCSINNLHILTSDILEQRSNFSFDELISSKLLRVCSLGTVFPRYTCMQKIVFFFGAKIETIRASKFNEYYLFT